MSQLHVTGSLIVASSILIPSRPITISAVASSPSGTIILLHGWGANQRDLVPLAEEIERPDLHFVFPQAPFDVPDTGGAGRGWYEIPPGASFEKELATSRVQVVEMLSPLSNDSRTMLLGFSQGAGICLEAARLRPQSVAGLILLSPFIPPVILEGAGGWLATIPCFVGIGRVDPMLPPALIELMRRHLQTSGAPLEWRDYPIGHHVSEEELADVRKFLDRVLPQPAEIPPRNEPPFQKSQERS